MVSDKSDEMKSQGGTYLETNHTQLRKKNEKSA